MNERVTEGALVQQFISVLVAKQGSDRQPSRSLDPRHRMRSIQGFPRQGPARPQRLGHLTADRNSNSNSNLFIF